ncbi:MAG: hypothetical protein IJE97_04810 [Thermoguttaceae bacterium]|nr:hypothetical protein [Thermoguttaceae bacterium]MBQ7111280.1 hypothetical protein [Thermoguttaceae bacterium]
MQIDVLLPTGTRTVDLEELKELVRQGVVQQSTLLETGGQRGKAKNVPALKPIFAELAAAPTQAPEPPSFPPIPTPPESPRTVESPNVPSIPTPPEPPVVKSPQTSIAPSTSASPPPPVFPSIPEEPRPLVFPQIATPEPPRPLDVSRLEQPSTQEIASPPTETTNAATPPEPPRFPEVSTSDTLSQFPPISPENNSLVPENAAVFPRVAPSSSAKSLKAVRAAKLEYWVKWGRGFLAVFDVAFALAALVYFVKFVFPAISDVFKAIDTPFYKETLLVCGSTFFGFLLAAFGYGLATILFRILFAATALYAASCEEEARNSR